MTHPFDEYKDTRLWHVVAAAVAELEATREIRIDTGRDYVIGYLCRRLIDGHVTDPAASTYTP
jgi:hypothetical protein